jgi:uncharacterized protein (DUF433 family)
MTTASLIDIGTLIESIPGVYGGRPRLARSGLPIIQLVAEIRGGRTIQEIIDAYANKAALDQDLDERNELGRKMAEEARPAQLELQKRLREKHRSP